MQPKTMTITGEAKVAFAPDSIVVSLRYQKVFPTYDEAVDRLSEHTGDLRNAVIASGLDGNLLKTFEFDVMPNYVSYKDKEGAYHHRLKGFQGTIGFEIQLCVDNAALSRLLANIRKFDDRIHFAYRLSDPEVARSQAVEAATKEAINKANIIAKAASIQFGDILNVDYSVKRISFDQDELLINHDCMTSSSGSPKIDITPNDLSVTESVTITFEIK